MAFAGGNPIAALIAHVAAARAAGQGPASVQTPQPSFGGGAASGGNPSQLVSQAIDILTRAQATEKDPIEREGLAKIVALLHGFAAREQKQKDAAMGAGPAVQLLRRQSG